MIAVTNPMTALPEPARIARYARRVVVAGAGLASMFAAPAILFVVLFDESDSYPAPRGPWIGPLLLVWMLVAAVLGPALMAYFTIEARAYRRAAASAFAGVLYSTLVLLAAPLVAEDMDEALDGVILVSVLLYSMGLVISVPTGLAFGAVFGLALRSLRGGLERPSMETPAVAWRTSALLCALASAVMTVCAWFAEGRYCIAYFETVYGGRLNPDWARAPEGLDIAWTRYLFAVPPIALAAALLCVAWVARRRPRALSRRVLAGDDPDWALVSGAPGHPVTEADRDAATEHLVARVDAYRSPSSTWAVARVPR